MNNNELLALREQILGDVVPLVLESADDGADRFSLLLRIVQAGNASGDVYKRAYESAKKIENADERLEALLALLDEIDFDTAQQIEAPETPTTPPEEQPAAEHNEISVPAEPTT